VEPSKCKEILHAWNFIYVQHNAITGISFKYSAALHPMVDLLFSSDKYYQFAATDYIRLAARYDRQTRRHFSLDGGWISEL
jgi:hypothetical protein